MVGSNGGKDTAMGYSTDFKPLRERMLAFPDVCRHTVSYDAGDGPHIRAYLPFSKLPLKDSFARLGT